MSEKIESRIDPMLEYAYRALACTAIFAGIIACVAMVPGHWPIVFIFYLAATVARVGAGATMNSMGNAGVVNSWNAGHHRFVVIVLNAGVGGVLLGRLVLDWFARRAHGEELAFFVTVIVLYSVIAKFTRPNTWGARVGSAFLTVAIAMVMAWISWPQHVSWITLTAVLVFCGAGYRIDQLQRRFGWAER